jgi:hypothetical protein
LRGRRLRRLAAREAEESRAAREAEEEKRAREAKETAAARDRAAGEGTSEREVRVEGRDGFGEGRGNEEGGSGGAVAKGTRRSENNKTMGADSQDAAAGSTEPGSPAKQGADGGKEAGEVEIEEVEGYRLGPAWDARDPSRRLGLGDVQVSLFRSVLFLNFTNQSSFIFQRPTRPCDSHGGQIAVHIRGEVSCSCIRQLAVQLPVQSHDCHAPHGRFRLLRY